MILIKRMILPIGMDGIFKIFILIEKFLFLFP